MGAGSYPAGVGPAGFDPPPTIAPRATLVAPVAQRFDPETRDFPLESGSEDANFVSSHPVDQGMALSLAIRRGTLASNLLVGHELDKVGGSSNVIAAKVAKTVYDAFPLRDLVTDGDVRILKIEHSWGHHGRLIVKITYTNVRTSKRATVSNG